MVIMLIIIIVTHTRVIKAKSKLVKKHFCANANSRTAILSTRIEIVIPELRSS